MIAELIATGITGAGIGYLIFYFKEKYDNKKMMTGIREKIEKQNKKFYADGKELNFYEEEVKGATDTVRKSIDKAKNKKPIKKVRPKKSNNDKGKRKPTRKKATKPSNQKSRRKI